MPRDSRMAPSDAAAMPLPSEDTTPPVTKTYLVMGMRLRESRMITEEPPVENQCRPRAMPGFARAGKAGSLVRDDRSIPDVHVPLFARLAPWLLAPLFAVAALAVHHYVP